MSIRYAIFACICVFITLAKSQYRTTPASLLPVLSLGNRSPLNNSRMDAVAKEIRSNSREFDDDYQLSRLIRRSFLIQKGGKLAFPLG